MEQQNIAILPLDSIVVKDDRQRKSFNPETLLALAENIRDSRLLHPPTIDTLESRTLVCGERRLKALRAIARKGLQITFNGELIPVGYAPFLVAGTQDILALEEIELNENKQRDNLTWQDEERAISRIADIVRERKRREVVAANPEVPVEDLPDIVVTQAEIAEAAEVHPATISRHEKLVDHLDDPDVAKAKTRKDAEKIIQKKRKTEHLAKMAAETKVKKSDHNIVQGDCRELIKKVPTGIVRTVITDPPYGIEMHKDQSWDGSWHEYDDTEAYCFNLIQSLIPEWDRVMLPDGHLYLFCDFAKFEKIRAIFDSYRYADNPNEASFVVSPESMLAHNMGLKELKSLAKTKPVFDVMYFPMIWNKGNVASYPRPDHWPRKSYECVLYAIKGNHKQTKLDLAVIDIPQIQNQDHPAGKPLALYEHFLLRSTFPGDVSLDCFAGQGNHLRAAHKNKRKSINFELSDQYYPLLAKAYRETEE
ncbi:MAG: adenine specific methyltransferase [Siphoviridae sp. ct7UA22]|nr:MAG: adenine specific methyltransferase [Siphoviridae sp. ct7UA22]